MPHRQTVGHALARAWEAQHPRTEPKPDWAQRLEPRHVRAWILRVVAAYDHACLALLPTRAPGPGRAPDEHLLPGMAARVPPELRQALRRRLADPQTWEIVEELGRIADERAGALRAAVDALPPGDRPPLDRKRLSEWACGTVARPYRVAPALPDPAWLDAAQAGFLQAARERAARTAPLPSEAEFADRYGPVYDRLWQERGAAALAVLDPVALGLGRLRRPPMSAAHNGWIVGTDQAVRLRYHYYLRTRWSSDPAAVAEAAGLSLDDHVGARLRVTPAEQVCRDELERACSPIGLRFPGHHGLCAAFVAGVERADLDGAFDDRTVPDSPRRPRGTGLADWAAVAPALPPTPDSALVTAVATHAEYWARHSRQVADLVDGIAPRSWPPQVRLGAARRLWSHLLHREVEWAAPFVRPEVPRLVRVLFSRHLNELKRTVIPAPDEPPDPGPAEAAPVDPDDPLLQATLAALHRDPAATGAMVAALPAGDGEWENMYTALTAGSPAPCLSIPAFHAWALDNLGDATGGE